MRKRCFVLLYIGLTLLFAHILPAGAQQYYYKQICLEEGLPSSVDCMLADEHGVMWIGTRAGLGRYDGNVLRMYKSNTDSLHSLPGARIHSIVEDKQRNVWVLTNKGVARYRKQYDDFERIVTDNASAGAAYSVCQVDDGLVFGCRNVLYFYSYKTSSLSVKQNLDHGFVISDMALWNDHIVLCYSRYGGVQPIDLRTGDMLEPPFDCGKDVRTLLVDSQRRIWVSPFNKGLRCYDSDGKLLASYTVQNSALSSDMVLCLAERNGELWIGTDGGGINVLRPQTGKITVLNHIPGRERHSLPSTSILCLYRDSYNNMWAGSVYGGLISIREVFAETYTETTIGNDDGLSGKVVQCLYRESDSRVWVGIDGGGINLFNPQTRKFTAYPTTLNDKIISICPYQSGRLLISAYSQGVYEFDPATGRKHPFIIINEQVNNRLCRQGRQLNLYRNAPGSILFMGERIYRHDLESRKTALVANPKGVPYLTSPLAIAQDGDSVFLFDSGHILMYNNRDNSLSNLFSCGYDTVFSSVSRDGKGHFWIGSNYGLMRYDAASKSLQNYPATKDYEISLVVCDRKGNVWIGAGNRLYALQIDEERVVRFGESDGIGLNEYRSSAFLLDCSGEVYMGGVMGLLRIGNNISLAQADMPQLRLTDVVVNGKRVSADLDNDNVAISVPWNSQVSLRVSSKEADIFRQKMFRYMIGGFNKQYIEIESPELIISSLPHGTYYIKVSCMTKYGTWSPDVYVLRLTVLPPWYLSWWFLLVCAILVISAVGYVFFRTLRHKDEKLRWAMKEHEQQVYEEKVRFLINISHELRTPLTLIYAPLSRMLKKLSPADEQYQSLNGIYRQAWRMKNLINMVLDVRKMEVGGTKLSVQPHPLNQWIGQVVADFVSEGQAMKVDIQSSFSQEVGIVNFDKEKCEIVLNNLLSNALKHSPEQTTITIGTRMLPVEGMVQVSVADEGCGLKQVDVSKLFTRFYQGAGETQGSGIGLSYAKMLIELHGGTIGAFDNANRSGNPADRGATFFFNLPLELEAEEVECPPKAYMNELVGEDTTDGADVADDFDTTPYTILVVDDNPDLTNFLKLSLADSFKQVLTAADGVEALDLAKSHAPDIVVSDVMMPRMNGYELCRTIKEDVLISHIPVVLLTARNDIQSRMSGYKNAADAYLTKPFEQEMLLAVVASRLKNREAIKKRYQQVGEMPNLEENTISAADEKFLVKLNQTIQDHLDKPDLDVAFICTEMGMSRTVLFTKLKAVTGMGVNDYVNKFRIEKAAALVVEGGLSVTEIAEHTGFSTSRYFSTVFKQYMGMTPTQYKKEHKGGE